MADINVIPINAPLTSTNQVSIPTHYNELGIGGYHVVATYSELPSKTYKFNWLVEGTKYFVEDSSTEYRWHWTVKDPTSGKYTDGEWIKCGSDSAQNNLDDLVNKQIKSINTIYYISSKKYTIETLKGSLARCKSIDEACSSTNILTWQMSVPTKWNTSTDTIWQCIVVTYKDDTVKFMDPTVFFSKSLAGADENTDDYNNGSGYALILTNNTAEITADNKLNVNISFYLVKKKDDISEIVNIAPVSANVTSDAYISFKERYSDGTYTAYSGSSSTLMFNLNNNIGSFKPSSAVSSSDYYIKDSNTKRLIGIDIYVFKEKVALTGIDNEQRTLLDKTSINVINSAGSMIKLVQDTSAAFQQRYIDLSANLTSTITQAAGTISAKVDDLSNGVSAFRGMKPGEIVDQAVSKSGEQIAELRTAVDDKIASVTARVTTLEDEVKTGKELYTYYAYSVYEKGIDAEGKDSFTFNKSEFTDEKEIKYYGLCVTYTADKTQLKASDFIWQKYGASNADNPYKLIMLNKHAVVDTVGDASIYIEAAVYKVDGMNVENVTASSVVAYKSNVDSSFIQFTSVTDNNTYLLSKEIDDILGLKDENSINAASYKNLSEYVINLYKEGTVIANAKLSDIYDSQTCPVSFETGAMFKITKDRIASAVADSEKNVRSYVDQTANKWSVTVSDLSTDIYSRLTVNDGSIQSLIKSADSISSIQQKVDKIDERVTTLENNSVSTDKTVYTHVFYSQYEQGLDADGNVAISEKADNMKYIGMFADNNQNVNISTITSAMVKTWTWNKLQTVGGTIADVSIYTLNMINSAAFVDVDGSLYVEIDAQPIVYKADGTWKALNPEEQDAIGLRCGWCDSLIHPETSGYLFSKDTSISGYSDNFKLTRTDTGIIKLGAGTETAALNDYFKYAEGKYVYDALKYYKLGLWQKDVQSGSETATSSSCIKTIDITSTSGAVQQITKNSINNWVQNGEMRSAIEQQADQIDIFVKSADMKTAGLKLNTDGTEVTGDIYSSSKIENSSTKEKTSVWALDGETGAGWVGFNGSTAALQWDSNGNIVIGGDLLTTIKSEIKGAVSEAASTARAIVSITDYYAILDVTTVAQIIDTKKNEFKAYTNAEDIPVPTKEKPYLWNYEKTVFSQNLPDSDKDYKETTPHIIARYTQDGKGIKAIYECYVASSSKALKDSDLTAQSWISPDIDTDTLTVKLNDTTTYNITKGSIPEGNKENCYIHNIEVILWSDSSYTITSPHIATIFGAVEISQKQYYKLGKSTEKPAEYHTSSADIQATWTEDNSTLIMTAEYDCIWTTVVITYDDGSIKENGPWASAVKGKSLTVSDTSVLYAVSTDSKQPGDTEFTSSSIPEASLGSYIWTRTKITYSDSTSVTSYSVTRIGTDGSAGSTTHFAYASDVKFSGSAVTSVTGFNTSMFDGAKFIGSYQDTNLNDSTNYADYKWTQLKGDKGENIIIKSNNIFYGVNDSPTEHPTQMDSSMPTVGKGQYLWTKTVVTYSDNTEVETWSCSYQGKDGDVTNAYGYKLVANNEYCLVQANLTVNMGFAYNVFKVQGDKSEQVTFNDLNITATYGGTAYTMSISSDGKTASLEKTGLSWDATTANKQFCTISLTAKSSTAVYDSRTIPVTISSGRITQISANEASQMYSNSTSYTDGKISTVNSNISRVEQTADGLSSDISDIQSSLSNQQDSIDSHDNIIDSLTTRTSRLEVSAGGFKSRFETVDSKFNTLDGSYTQLNKNVSEISATSEQLQSTVSSYNSSLNSMSSSITQTSNSINLMTEGLSSAGIKLDSTTPSNSKIVTWGDKFAWYSNKSDADSGSTSKALMYLDTNSGLHVKGNIDSSSGSIGGFSISKIGLQTTGSDDYYFKLISSSAEPAYLTIKSNKKALDIQGTGQPLVYIKNTNYGLFGNVAYTALQSDGNNVFTCNNATSMTLINNLGLLVATVSSSFTIGTQTAYNPLTGSYDPANVFICNNSSSKITATFPSRNARYSSGFITGVYAGTVLLIIQNQKSIDFSGNIYFRGERQSSPHSGSQSQWNWFIASENGSSINWNWMYLSN